MHVGCGIVVLVLSAGMLAQTSPVACPTDRPIDDIISELNKQDSKKSSRNRDPLPHHICIFGWCHDASKTPPTVPDPTPHVETSRAPEGSSSSSSSSTKIPVDKCNEAMLMVIKAAHDVEVGDYYFTDKNYRAALFRYQDALELKSEDAAIHVRLGRAFEKLGDPAHAMEHYQAAEQLTGPEKWIDEARAALTRLH